MIALLTLAALLDATPAPAATTTATPAPAVSAAPLPSDPEQIAKEEWAQFSSGKVDQSRFITPIPQKSIDQLGQVLPTLGAVKSVALVKQADTPQGKGYAYKFTCENGAAIEQFIVDKGKIVSIWISPAQ